MQILLRSATDVYMWFIRQGTFIKEQMTQIFSATWNVISSHFSYTINIYQLSTNL